MATSLNYTPAFAAGRTNQSIANSILNGRGAPTAKIGINGDFYIDTLTFNMYGPKAKNRWPAPVNLRGPAGTDGKNGDKGQTSIGAEGARGPKGDIGPQGLKGDKGEKGDKGDVGERGIQGLVGLTGAVGPAGAKGETGSTGATGAAGLKGDKGDAGIAGIAGAKGDAGTAGTNGTNGTNGLPGAKGDKGDPGDAGAQGIQGVQGPAGPSNVRVGNISFANPLQGAAGVGQNSSAFGNFEAGKSYIVDVLIWGISSSNTHSLKLNVTSSDNSVQPVSHWFTALGTTYRNNSVASEYSFMGRIAIDGSQAATSYNLIANVTTGGPIIAGESVTLAGGFSGQLVGSITS